ncbi:MAG: hypothetical protein JXD22_03060 [Sedimentisphaerales bacterium]|nr:hypothetical protein [Sedimentisphaerales bacterium]
MFPDNEIIESGLLIVTGSTLRAEQADRPLAYHLKNVIEKQLLDQSRDLQIVVIGDLWYLNSQALQKIPMISVGGPGVNAVAANLYEKLSKTLIVDERLVIQMDLHLQDLRASVWGTNHELTVNAVELFIDRGLLKNFLSAVLARCHD